MAEVVYISNDNLITLSGLKDASEGGDYINNAIVEVTLLDSDGNEVAGQSWPATMSYVSGSDGIYEGILEDGLSLSVDDELTARVTVDAGSDSLAQWDVPAVARTRVE